MKSKFDEVLNKVIISFNSDNNVIGAVLYGSFAKGIYHSHSDIDLIVIATETEHKMTCKIIDKIPVQMLWLTAEMFKEKAAKEVRTKPIAKDFKVLIDKKNWIEEYIKSDQVYNTWKAPIKIHDKLRLKKSIDFQLSISQLKGFKELGKNVEIEMFISEYTFLGLDLFYDKNGWFIESKKHILDDVKNRSPKLAKLIFDTYNSNELEDKMSCYEEFYDFIMSCIDEPPREYSITL
ncbi:nucleotidyltransferase domain-containing protein [Oceanirhabdus sp. W0125-5]|uniref:nucleotidyltransferase domain-containing protein n=1 Tax=Oceanirhabdus sp. W0125-5 TaxID=2999116 RepID=UPI0022F2BCE4|nr:nucleotidyltransferase domain-containing protein [Oceanirhabdus sp. W0125-5]WBW94975.1 nucleotidyltransferase domain-containing protein [Oceanirhabdus sp. W0125-5]